MDDLAARLQRLEDAEAIRKLKARYSTICDSEYDSSVADLFTEDAILEAGVFGRAVGQDDIRTFFQGLPGSHHFSLHYVSNPLVEVSASGETATGSWYLWQPNTAVEDGQERALIIAGRYDDEFRKIDGEWRFSRMQVTFAFITPYEEGWVQRRFAR
jgi:ketosteroid isomerase-like protein